MKRFLVFAGDTYYPCGGWVDFHSSHDTLDSARDAANLSPWDWFQIVDTQTMQIVKG